MNREGKEDVEAAARALVARLLEIHDNPMYQAVWTCAHIHGMPYKGPTYEHELKALQGALASPRAHPESSEDGPNPPSEGFPKGPQSPTKEES